MMANGDPLREDLENRIDLLEGNLRDLIEQAAAYSGAEDEDRTSDRIAELEREIATLKDQRDKLS